MSGKSRGKTLDCFLHFPAAISAFRMCATATHERMESGLMDTLWTEPTDQGQCKFCVDALPTSVVTSGQRPSFH